MFYHKIYLLQEREFIHKNQNVYKLGKTKQENVRRIQSYPKGTDLIFCTKCDDCDTAENDLIQIFKTKFIQQTEIGREYFKGDLNEMRSEIIKYFKLDKTFVTKEIITDTGVEADVEQNVYFNENNEQYFYCKKCSFQSWHKNDFRKHCQTVKHRSFNGTVNFLVLCENCNKGYNSLVGLWKHAKKCI